MNCSTRPDRCRGFTLPELALALGIASVSLGGMWTLSQSIGQTTNVRLIARQTLAVASAARDYVATHRTAVMALVPALTNVTEITTATLVTASLLPSDFVNRNAYGQTYKVYVRREDAGAAGADTSDNLVTLVLTTGGTTIPDKMASSLVGSMGAAGGFLFADSNPTAPTAATTARGAMGGWSVNLSAAGWSTIGATATAGHIAVLANILPHSTDGGTLGGGGGGGGGGAGSIDELSDATTDYPNYNLFMGQGAGASITSGTYNEAFGVDALGSTTTGAENTAIGEDALFSNADGYGNVAVGNSALQSNTSGVGNTAVGYEALYTNDTHTSNVAIGTRALRKIDTSYNVAVGSNALSTATYGGDNVVVGEGAGEFLADGLNDTVIIGTYAAGIATNTCNSCDYLTIVGGLAMERMDTPGYSTAIGYKALYEDTDYRNTAVGWEALLSNTTGSANTGVGQLVLADNTTGSDNTAVGVSAGGTNNNNTAVGFQALVFTHDIGLNTAIGANAARVVNTGGDVVAIGESALLKSTVADETVVIGVNAADDGGSFTGATIIGDSAMRYGSGSYSTAIGKNTLYQASGDFNLAIGPSAGQNITTGSENVGIGREALYHTTVSPNTGSRNVAVGRQALAKTSTGDYNVAVGYQAKAENDTGHDNVAVGYQSLLNSTESFNTAVGSMSGSQLGLGIDNTLVGYNAGLGLKEGNRNTLVGAETMKTDVLLSSDNTGIGALALGNSSVSYATAVGYKALYAVTGNNYSIAFGYEAAAALTSGNENIAIGHEALYKSGTTNTASNNIAIGYQALRAVTSGGNNVAIGYQAGSAGVAVTTGTNNTFIGYQAQANANNYTNGTALGNGAVLTASNSIVLGNTSIAGIYAQVNTITGISDARRKRDIADLPFDARTFLRALHPQQYRYNNGDETLRFGFIAQELEAALPEPLRGLVSKQNGLALVLRDSDPDHTYRANYGELIAPLVKAIQDVDTSDAAKDALIREQDTRITRIEARIRALEDARSRK